MDFHYVYLELTFLVWKTRNIFIHFKWNKWTLRNQNLGRVQLEKENATTWCAVGKGQQEHIPFDLSESEGWWLNKLGIGLTLWKVYRYQNGISGCWDYILDLALLFSYLLLGFPCIYARAELTLYHAHLYSKHAGSEEKWRHFRSHVVSYTLPT